MMPMPSMVSRVPLRELCPLVFGQEGLSPGGFRVNACKRKFAMYVSRVTRVNVLRVSRV